MSCSRPLDPIDLEALASGEAPVLDPGAAPHAQRCPECGSRLARMRELAPWLALPGETSPDLTRRVLRLRPFSRRERRSPRLWAPPLAAAAALWLASAFLLSAPVLTAGEQAGLAAAVGGALAREIAALLAWPGAAISALPSASAALGEAVAGSGAVLACGILLVGAGAALRRVAWRRRSRA